MATMLSPSVKVREWDLTNIVPGVSTTEGGIAGMFSWGPVNERVLIDSETELYNTFWKPNNTNADDWFSAASFLAYGDKLWVVRVVDEENANTTLRAKNATAANSAGYLVKNEDQYENSYFDGSLQSTYGTGSWIAKYPGALGNTLKVSVCPSANAFESTLTGTVSVSANSTTVTGTSTVFTSQVTIGDLLVINNETVKVTAIANNTSLTISTRHVQGAVANSCVRRWEYYNEVDTAPGTSDYAALYNSTKDEMHIVVVDEDGQITGQQNVVLEVYQKVSKASDGKLADGSTNYYKEMLKQKSNYVYWAGHPGTITNIGSAATNGTAFGTYAKPLNYSMVGGKDGAAIGNAQKIRGYNYFQSKEDVEVSIIVGSSANQTVATHIINNICEPRMDCIAFFSPPKAYCVNNAGDEAVDIVNFRNTLPVTSYAALDCNWKYMYDRYNDVYRYIPGCGDVAGLHVKTDEERDAWWAAAGFNRGHVKNTVKLAWNPKQADRDYLYKNNVNPIATFPGDGTVLFGQKTMLSKPSAFDRINVRRLFIVLEKAISRASKYLLFEFNDEFTRSQFRNMVEPYLRDVKGRRGIYDFLVVCDESNNTPEVIDRNEFVGDIYIKPARTAEFIRLNFIAARTGVDFSEIVGKFGG